MATSLPVEAQHKCDVPSAPNSFRRSWRTLDQRLAVGSPESAMRTAIGQLIVVQLFEVAVFATSEAAAEGEHSAYFGHGRAVVLPIIE